MVDSVSKTNIPVLRMPYGAELPPKVPVCELDDTGSEINPVYVKDRVIKASGASLGGVQQPIYLNEGKFTICDVLAPVLAPSLIRDSGGGTTTVDVPTSPTPQDEDPDTMIATKKYVDDHSSGIPLFTPMWLDYIPTSEPYWIKAYTDTNLTTSNMIARSLHQSVYDHLANDYNNGTEQTQTFTLKSGSTVTITYRLAADKHKVCATSQISNLNAIFNDETIGTAWFFVVDTTNQMFHVPRTKYGFHGNLSYVKRTQEAEESMYLYFYAGKK